MGTRATHIKRPLVAGVLLLCLAAGTGQARAGDFEDMVAAERAFSADAAARSTRDAFVAALASDSLLFAPGPTSGQRLWSGRAADKSRLEWTPAMAEIAISGDLGYTVGPFRFTPAGGDKPAAYGWFLSIWSKQADGAWKLLVEHTVDAPEAPFPEAVQRRGGISLGAPPAWLGGTRELRGADLAVPAGQLEPRLVSADFLRLRANQAPDGKAAGLPMDSHATRLDTGLAVSGAGDLGVTWGGGARSPAWIRVWRRPAAEDAAGAGWRLAVDYALQARAEPSP